MKPFIVLLTCLMVSGFAYSDDRTPNKEEYATIHLYRNHSVPAMFYGFRMKINGEKMKVKDNHSYEIKVKPGTTAVKIYGFGKREFSINIEPAKDYYLKSYLQVGMLASHPDFVEVTPDFAISQMDKIKEKNRERIEL